MAKLRLIGGVDRFSAPWARFRIYSPADLDPRGVASKLRPPHAARLQRWSPAKTCLIEQPVICGQETKTAATDTAPSAVGEGTM